MPPKPKDTANKKPAPQIVRPSISNSSLNYIPDDAIEGFNERIESGVEWTLQEEAARYHKRKCNRDDNIEVTLSKALQNKIEESILHGFLESDMSLREQWESLLPMVLWDNEKFANEEKKICFNAKNSLTDNIYQLIKKAVRLNDRSVLKKEFNNISVLRLMDAKITTLDSHLLKFQNLNTLNLCGNFITNINAQVLPKCLKMLELQSNNISNVETLVNNLPEKLIYLGLARNSINNESLGGLAKLRNITVLDLSDNDICDLIGLLSSLVTLSKLTSLMLAGNPCAVCTAYVKTTTARLPQLKWLDSREVMETYSTAEPFEPHPSDLRSSYFYFTIFRIISVPPPPKSEKGATTSFHVELDLPLLDSKRRKFLMFRHNESLIECLPPSEDGEWSGKIYPSNASQVANVEKINTVTSLTKSDIYNQLVAKNSREIRHYTVFESNKIQWNKIMNFQEPAVRIFCPNLVALRDTFRTVVTVRLIYTVFALWKILFTQSTTNKHSKTGKKSSHSLKQPSEHRVTLATVRCALRRLDWRRPSQHFHWDDSLESGDAVHWDNDLSVVQYSQGGVKPTKMKPDSDVSKQLPPDNLSCHFGFGIDTI